MKANPYRWAGALLLFSSLVCGAQTSYSDRFFLTDSPEAFRFNPALVTGLDFISVGGVDLHSRGNVGATTFLYDYDGKTVTALNPSVPESLFYSRLHQNNYAMLDYRINLFSYGFMRDRNYHTAEVTVRSISGATVPRDIFEILKSGINKSSFDFSNTRLSEDLYLEFAYGWSRRLTDIVSVGARAKLLLGMTSIDAYIRDFRVGQFDDETFKARFEANLDISGYPRFKGYDGGTLLNPGPKARRLRIPYPRGVGMAFDLGVAITPNEYLTLSASANDLGFLCWFYGRGGSITAYFDPSILQEYATEEVSLDQIMGLAVGIAGEVQESAVIQQKKAHAGFRAVPFAFNLGVKYKMPFYEALSVGLTGHLTTYRISPYWETRLGVTVQPLDWLDLSGNFGLGTYGPAYGALASFRISRFHLNLAYQRSLGGSIPRTGIPMKPFGRTLTAGLTYDL